MVALRLASSRYLGIGFAIATGVAAASGSSGARAQDLNLQNQLNILSPLPSTATASPPATDVTPSKAIQSQTVASAVANKKCSTGDKQKDEDLIGTVGGITVRQYFDMRVEQYSEKYAEYLKKSSRKFPLIPPSKPNLSCTDKQPTTITFGLPINPTYETDVLKKGNNSSPGESFGVGGNVLVTTGVENHPYDLVVLYGAAASQRYSPTAYSSQNVDSTNAYMAYQAFLYADGCHYDSKNTVPLKCGISVDRVDPQEPPPIVPDPNLTTFDTLAFGIQNQTAFVPTFHAEKTDFFTPQFTLASQNINLDDRTETQDCAKNLQAFCHYLNLSLTVGQSFADVTTQQNFNVAGSAIVGWRLGHALDMVDCGNDKTTPCLRYYDWTLALQGTATGKDFENFVGGRQDLLLQVGPVLTVSRQNSPLKNGKPIDPSSGLITESVSFMLPVTYNKNFSTVSAAAYSSLVIQPTLTISFSSQAKADMPK
jgi:hypothetical protein